MSERFDAFRDNQNLMGNDRDYEPAEGKVSEQRIPDWTPGDVIAAYVDGTIVLDDGLTTWNPERAKKFLATAAPAQPARSDEGRPWSEIMEIPTTSRPLTLQEWLTERLQNARRLADEKTDADREGWLEDARYFDEALRAAQPAGELKKNEND